MKRGLGRSLGAGGGASMGGSWAGSPPSCAPPSCSLPPLSHSLGVCLTVFFACYVDACTLNAPLTSPSRCLHEHTLILHPGECGIAIHSKPAPHTPLCSSLHILHSIALLSLSLNVFPWLYELQPVQSLTAMMATPTLFLTP